MGLNAVGASLANPVNSSLKVVVMDLSDSCDHFFAWQGSGDEANFVLKVADSLAIDAQFFDRKWQPVTEVDFDGMLRMPMRTVVKSMLMGLVHDFLQKKS